LRLRATRAYRDRQLNPLETSRVSYSVQRTDFPHFEEELRARATALRNEIRDSLLKTDRELYAELAGQVHDAGDQSVANLLVDVNQAEIARDIREIRDIESAQQRLNDGSYGVCQVCEEKIARARLDAYPTAKRCLRCQRAHEQSPALRRPASL
jgi:RNA polymerase-binding transcription factor DksA